jgi:tRNA nucleotidyltransferase/poly(A) polymerase
VDLPERIPIPEAVVAIARRLEEAGHEAWCVGGAVRDTLLGDVQKDFDLATSATPDQVQGLFLWGDLEESIIDAVFKTESFAYRAGINFLYWSMRMF